MDERGIRVEGVETLVFNAEKELATLRGREADEFEPVPDFVRLFGRGDEDDEAAYERALPLWRSSWADVLRAVRGQGSTSLDHAASGALHGFLAYDAKRIAPVVGIAEDRAELVRWLFASGLERWFGSSRGFGGVLMHAAFRPVILPRPELAARVARAASPGDVVQWCPATRNNPSYGHSLGRVTEAIAAAVRAALTSVADQPHLVVALSPRHARPE